jgi:uncharacterized RDD family membrane protein YckC
MEVPQGGNLLATYIGFRSLDPIRRNCMGSFSLWHWLILLLLILPAGVVLIRGGDSSQSSKMATGLARAWPRYWSRGLDLSIWSIPIYVVLLLVLPEEFSNPDSLYPLLKHLLSLPFALAIDALVLAVFGNTPGRALMGIRVETIRRERLSISMALARNGQIWIKGLGLGIPFILLFTCVRNFMKLRHGQPTSWDESFSTRVFNISNTPIRTWVVAATHIFLLAGDRLVSRADAPPPDPALSAAARAALYERTLSTLCEVQDDGSCVPVARPGEPASPSDPVVTDLKNLAAQITPRRLDAITRLDGATSEGRTLIYHYTVSQQGISDEEFARFFRETIRPSACKDAEMVREMQDFQITYRYEYNMPDKDKPFVLNIAASDCK